MKPKRAFEPPNPKPEIFQPTPEQTEMMNRLAREQGVNTALRGARPKPKATKKNPAAPSKPSDETSE